MLRRGFGLATCVALLVSACGDDHEPRDPSQYFHPPDAGATEALPDAPGADPEVRIAWFGHSLVQRPGDVPIDLPKLVADLHHAARIDGRTRIAERPPRAFTLLNRHLGHHLDGPGDAEAALRTLGAEGVTHVVGIGFMHMLGEGWFARPTLGLWLQRIGLSGFDSPRRHTEHVYRFMALMKQHAPRATWVSYVGPALANNIVPQPAIDARYACIEQTAHGAGMHALSAHVGHAFRSAEQRGASRPELALKLNTDDSLHLSPQGAVLAASVLYQRIYGVDPVGLTVPGPYYQDLGAGDDARRAVARFLQEVARDTNATYAPPCDDAALLPEDARARNQLGAR
ncbi:MAG: hypothetical protein ABW252_22535 [Polyangiales bacterium]